MYHWYEWDCVFEFYIVERYNAGVKSWLVSILLWWQRAGQDWITQTHAQCFRQQRRSLDVGVWGTRNAKTYIPIVESRNLLLFCTRPTRRRRFVKWTNEQMNKWTNEQMNKWTNGAHTCHRFKLLSLLSPGTRERFFWGVTPPLLTSKDWGVTGMSQGKEHPLWSL